MRFVPRVGLATLCLTVLAAVVPPASAQDPEFRLERVVPADAFALVTVPDASAVQKAFSRTALSKIYHDEEVQAFLAPLVAFIEEQVAELKDEEGVDLLDALSCLRGEVGFAFIDMDLGQGAPQPNILVAVDTRENHAKALKLLDLIVGKIREDNERLKVTEREVRGVKVRVLDDDRTRIDVAFFGSTFVLASNAATLDGAVNAWAGGSATSLAGSPRYQKTMAKVTGTGTPVVRVFVNVERILTTYADMIEPYSKILEETGVLGIHAVAFSSTMDGSGFTDRFHLRAPGETRGLFRLVSRRGVDRKALALVPEGALHVTAGTMDVAKVWDEVMRVLATVQPDAFADVAGNIEQAEGFLGFRLREELIASLGGDFLLYASAPKGGGLIPEVVLGLSLKDSETFLKCVDAALGIVADQAGDDFRRDSMQFQGHTIHYAKIGGMPLVPSWAVVENRLLVSLLPQTLKSLIRNMAAEKPRPSILQNEAFSKGLAALPESSCLVSYTDLPSAFNLLYNTALPFIQAFSNQLGDVPLDFAMLPSAEAVSQHLAPALSGMWADDEGISTVAHAPVSVLTAMTTLAPAVLLMTVGGEAEPMEFEIAEARPEPEGPRDADIANLDEIGAGLLIHYVEQGKYPATFEELVKTRALPDASVLVSPGDKGPRMVGSVKCSYEYAGPTVARLKGNKHRVVVAWSMAGPRRAVLFLDGGVRRVPESEFQNLLAETKKRMAGQK